MLGNKDPILKDMKDLEKTVQMYKDAFPDNPVFSSIGKKKEKTKKQD
jgi:hypothetical protein